MIGGQAMVIHSSRGRPAWLARPPGLAAGTVTVRLKYTRPM